LADVEEDGDVDDDRANLKGLCSTLTCIGGIGVIVTGGCLRWVKGSESPRIVLVYIQVLCQVFLPSNFPHNLYLYIYDKQPLTGI